MRQIGNAVPVSLAYILASHLIRTSWCCETEKWHTRRSIHWTSETLVRVFQMRFSNALSGLCFLPSDSLELGFMRSTTRVISRRMDRLQQRTVQVGSSVRSTLERQIPPGARKGGFGLGVAPGFALFQRLREHSNSIEQARNLQLADFRCRYLISDDIWIPLGESLTIERFQPIWNVVLDGFGNHPPGGGRQRQERSKWDAVHPGRPWADALPSHHQAARDLLQLVREFLAGRRGPILTPEQAVTAEE